MTDYRFGNLLASQRRGLGLTQFQLAELLGVTNKAVSKWENGRSKPRFGTCLRLADLLGVSLNDLLLASGNDTAM